MNQFEIKNLTITEDCFSKGDYLVSFALKKNKTSSEVDCLKEKLDPYKLNPYPVGAIDPLSLSSDFFTSLQPLEPLKPKSLISPSGVSEPFISKYPTLSPLSKDSLNKLSDSLKTFQLNQINEKLQKIAVDLKDLTNLK